VYDTASILKFITRRYGLEPLPGVREKTGDLSAALQ
jgi:phospholipase C